MAMSLKQELEVNALAVAAFDKGEHSAAYEQFEMIADSSSKIRFNMGIILATIGQHEDALVQYQASVRMDRYLAVAYFQAGVSSFLLGNFEDAQGQFDDAYLYLRGNPQIDYEQLGLKFKLYACEILFNRALCAIYRGSSSGLQDLAIIDQALRDRGTGYTVFSVPTGILYRPDEAKLRNIAVKDYLGKARLIASIDASDVSTGFRGYEKAQAASARANPVSLTDDASSEVNGLLSRFSFTSRSNSIARRDKNMEYARELEFSRLDDELRKASVSSVRGNFPPPVRSRSLFNRSRNLPPTPPRTESRASSRQSSYASSTLSDKQASPSPRYTPALSRSMTITPPSSLQKSLPRIGRTRLDLPPSPRSLSPIGARSADAFSQKLAMLSMNTSQTSLPTSLMSRQASSSSHISSRQPSLLEVDEEADLIDDYYSRSSMGDSHSPHNHSMSVARIKVRVYGCEDTRVITIDTDTTLSELHARLRDKFNWQVMPKLRTRDEDDEMILLQDQEDLSICLETAVLEAQRAGKETGKLEIWVKV